MSSPVRSTAMAVRKEATAAAPFVQTTAIGKILLSDEARGQIAALVPHGVDYERVVLEVHRATIKTPEILKCTPASIIMAVGQAVQTGLEIGRTIHLVPVDGKLQAWNDYKGDIELVIWSGAARHIDAQCVYANDHFEYRQGSNPDIDHRPATKNRGPLIGAYCIAWLNGLGTLKKIAYSPLEDINKTRAKSRSWKNGECPPWYAIKTMIHLNTKTLPRTRKLATVLSMMDNRESADIVDGEGEVMVAAQLRNPLDDAPSIGVAEYELAPDPAESRTDAVTPIDTEPEPEDDVLDEAMTIETALGMPLPGGPKAWNGKGGTPLGQLSPRMIPQIHDWIGKKIVAAEVEDGDGNAPPIHYRLQAACALIIAARNAEAAAAQPALELNEKPAPTAPPSNAIAPGKIEDALDIAKTTMAAAPAPAPATPLRSLKELAASVGISLRSEKLTPDERAQYRAKFDKAETAEAMQVLDDELKKFLNEPF